MPLITVPVSTDTETIKCTSPKLVISHIPEVTALIKVSAIPVYWRGIQMTEKVSFQTLIAA